MTTKEYKRPEINELSQNVHILNFDNGKKLYLVGTAHVSADSVKLVEDTIRNVKPDTVCIELDDQRYQSMIKKNKYEDIDFIQIIRKKQLFFFIGQFMMASYQKKISEKTGSRPGEEFKKGIEVAEETGAHLVLADRNIGTTLKRAWRLTPFMQKMKFLGGLLFSDDEEIDKIDIESIKTRDAIDSLVDIFADELPVTKRVLIDERDFFLTAEIQENLGDVTVAVVGAGHVPGMIRNFQTKLSKEEKNKINIVPSPSLTGRLMPWIIPAVILAVFAWGFINGRKEIAQDVAVFWVLANGILTAIGCLISLAHPLTIVAGFIAAPITSLNPTIGAGFVTAIVQTLLVKPRIRDFEQIQNHSLKIRGWWSNRITKIFLVFVFSSIGSSIGTFVALPALVKFFNG